MLTKTRTQIGHVASRARRFAIGSAWFFVVFSLVQLAWVVAIKGADPGGMTSMYQTSVMSVAGADVHRAWGLTYDGFPGLLFALFQAAVVATALAVSVLGRGRLRLVAHGTLIAWAGLWMLDLMYLAGVERSIGSFGQASLMTILAGATVVRAVVGRRPATKLAPAPPEITADDIVVSPDVEEIPTPAGRWEETGRRAQKLVETALNRGRQLVRERWPRATPTSTPPGGEAV